MKLVAGTRWPSSIAPTPRVESSKRRCCARTIPYRVDLGHALLRPQGGQERAGLRAPHRQSARRGVGAPGHQRAQARHRRGGPGQARRRTPPSTGSPSPRRRTTPKEAGLTGRALQRAPRSSPSCSTSYARSSNDLSPREMIDAIVRESGMGDALRAENTDEAYSRLENLGELASAASAVRHVDGLRRAHGAGRGL